MRQDDDSAFKLAELLRTNGYEAVIGDQSLLLCLDYRFDAVWVRGELTRRDNPTLRRIVEGSSSLLEHGDVALPVGISEQEILARLRDAFRP